VHELDDLIIQLDIETDVMNLRKIQIKLAMTEILRAR
jgi:hypothetical protein